MITLKQLDVLGFFISGFGTVGVFLVLSLTKLDEITVCDDKHVGTTNVLRPFWQKTKNRKEIAFWLMDNGMFLFVCLSVIGFALQIPIKFY